MSLNAGDIVFLGFDADNNDVVLMTTTTVSEGEVLYFTDTEWNGTSFNPGEQIIRWTVPNDLTPGSLITIDMQNAAQGGADAFFYEGVEPGDPNTESLGGVEYLRGGGSLARGNEQFWVVQGTYDETTGELVPDSTGDTGGFVSVISNEEPGAPNGPVLDGTGLSETNGAVLIPGDEDFTIFDPVKALPEKEFLEPPEILREQFLELVGDVDNWTTDDGGGTQNAVPGFDFNIGSLAGLPQPITKEDITTLYFLGDRVAFFNAIDENNDGFTTISPSFTFLPTDVFEIDIVSTDIEPNGEFNYDQVIFTRITLVRDGQRIDFDFDSGSKVNTTGGPNSGAKEQGDSFFTLDDDVAFPNASIGDVEGSMAFSLDEGFLDAFGNSQPATIERSRPDLDTNGDGLPDGGPPITNENFNVGSILTPPPIPCFLAGTLLLTPTGPRRVETLEEGDLVLTRDNGPQAVRWIGTIDVPADAQFAPVVFSKGVLGNSEKIAVSPHHRVLVSGARTEMLFGLPECLVSAISLCDGDRIYQDRSAPLVKYVHIMFDQHELVYSSGLWSESYFPTAKQDQLADGPVERELRYLFPEIFNTKSRGTPVRPLLRAFEGQIYISRN